MNGEALMRDIVAAFERAELEPLLSALHPDVVWISASRIPGLLSFHGEYKGRHGVTELLAEVAKDYTFHSLKPRCVTSRGNVVWGLFDVALSYDPKGKRVSENLLRLDMAFRWVLKDGKIIEHQGFFDTAYLLEQQRAA
jgi:ketosteroid isomerase-like protein